MAKYRHVFHAGNFADVHKHVALLALLHAMQRKDKGFLYVDTHAGEGRYDLDAAAGHHGAEAKSGVTALLQVERLSSAELQNYCTVVKELRAALDDAHAYPGSPWFAAHSLRAQDRGVCCEMIPSECRRLERALGGARRMRVLCGDGWRELGALLPPLERRALVLIDPPYERTAEDFEQAARVIAESLPRLANVVIALWYPIKNERSLTPWLQRMQQLPASMLSLEFWLYPRDSRVGLNGSGLLIVNPPYQLDTRAEQWQTELSALLDPGRRGGSSTRWLVRDEDLHRAGA